MYISIHTLLSLTDSHCYEKEVKRASKREREKVNEMRIRDAQCKVFVQYQRLFYFKSHLAIHSPLFSHFYVCVCMFVHRLEGQAIALSQMNVSKSIKSNK